MPAEPRQHGGDRTGLGVDARGDPVIDPTENVMSLVEASNKRQDDLREMHNRLTAAEVKRLDAALAHVKEMQELRADHSKEIGALESNRLNAIRQVDVLAVNTAADRAAAAIQALAATTTTNAENLRNALNSTATTIATQTANTVAAMTERIAALEKSMYEGKGKAGVSDPMMAELTAEIKSLRESRSTTTGQGQGASNLWGWIVGAAGLLIAAAIYLRHVP